MAGMQTLMILALALALEGDGAKKALEDFKAAAAKAKSPDEKARAIGALAATRIDDPSFVPAVARYLSPAPGDVHSLLPIAASEFLARLRGDRGAAQALLAALPSFKKIPFIWTRCGSSGARWTARARFHFRKSLRFRRGSRYSDVA